MQQFWQRFSLFFLDLKTRRRFLQKLAKQLGARRSLHEALLTLLKSAGSKGQLACLAKQLLLAISRGASFSQAWGRFGKVSEVLLLEAYEERDLAQGLKLTAALLGKEEALWLAFKKGLIYPFWLFLLLCGVFLAVAHVLVPALSLVLELEKLEAEAQALVQVALFFKDGTKLFLGGSLLSFLIYLIYLSLGKLSGPLRKILDHLWPYSLYKRLIGTVWLLQLSALLTAGQKPREIFARNLRQKLSPYLRSKILALDSQMALGFDLGQAFWRADPNFPSASLVNDLLIYATLPNFALELACLSDEELSETIAELEKSLKILKVFLILVVTAFIFFILKALFSLQLGLGQAGFF